jgi:hypothetical protein
VTKRLATMCLAAICAIGVGPPAIRGDDGEESRATLKGITSVHVLVEDLDADAQRIGLTTQAIQTDVELKLFAAGMHVVTTEEWLKMPGAPRLYINVSVLPPQAASISVELDQNVRLERNGERAVSANTWDSKGVMANPTEQGVRREIGNHVDQFLKAWRSANSGK